MVFRISALIASAALLAICLSSDAFGQGLMEGARSESAFALSITQEFGADAAPSIVVTVAVPYRRLVFFAQGDRFESRYRVYLELEDKHGNVVRGEVWEESVVAGSFAETGSASLVTTSRRTFPVVPGDYKAVVTVEVVDTSRRLTQEQAVRVMGEGAGRLEISTPVFYTQPPDSLVPRPGDGEIAVSLCATPVQASRIDPDAIFGDFDGWAQAVTNLVAPAAAAGGPLALTARISNEQGIFVRYARKTFGAIEGARAAICLGINFDSFDIGAYRLEIVVETGDGAQKSEAEGRFTVLFDRGLLGPRVAELVELLSLVADSKEAAAIAAAPPAERGAAWNAFWRKRDPTPSTQANEAFGEFLRRLQYVLTSFSQRGPGWRTDMGKTYLTNGPPDRVEDRQDASTGRSYQLWYYNSRGFVYIFEDTIGTGDYHLVTTEMI